MQSVDNTAWKVSCWKLFISKYILLFQNGYLPRNWFEKYNINSVFEPHKSGNNLYKRLSNVFFKGKKCSIVSASAIWQRRNKRHSS